MPQPLVALQTALPQFADPVELQTKAYSLRALNAQAQAADQARMDDQGARAAFAANPTDGAARLSALAGVSPRAYGDEAKRQADAAKTGADTMAKQLEVAHKQIGMASSAFGYVRQNPTRENAVQAVQWLGQNGVLTPDMVAQHLAKIESAAPEQIQGLADMAFRSAIDAKDQLMKIETRDTGGAVQTVGVDPISGASRPLSSLAKTPTPDNIENNRVRVSEGAADRAAAAARQERQLAVEGARRSGQVMQTDDGPMLVDTRTGEGRPITTNGQPVQARAKSIPAAVQKAMTENDSALRKIDDALAAVDKYPDALGAINVLGDGIRQRTDPEGVEVRALVADIGSLKLHDRSGAAVTASETPRLKPFIPAATDTPETVKKKLKLFRREYDAIQGDIRSAYPQETRRRSENAKQPAAPLPSGWSVEVH